MGIKKIKDENKKLEELEDSTVEEIKDYADDVRVSKLKIFDGNPLLQKIVFFAVGISNFIIGFALYFIVKDDKKKSWASHYFIIGALIGALIEFLELIF